MEKEEVKKKLVNTITTAIEKFVIADKMGKFALSEAIADAVLAELPEWGGSEKE
jgi:hypothetical protein